MKDRNHYCKNGYVFSVQQIGNMSHLIISDRNIYPDDDSRSNDYWRLNGGLLIPINNKEDLKEISKLFK